MNNRDKNPWLAALLTIFTLVASMWLVEIVNNFYGHQLNIFGIYPRQLDTLPGILLWPFLHGSLQHLLMNTTPLLAMGYFVAVRGRWVFFKTTLFIVLASGLAVWLFGRSAYHIGSSGLVFGYFGFLVAIGLYERSIISLAVASLTLFYYGGIVVGLLPTDSYISWEAHLFGLFAGVLSARLMAIPGRQVQ